jgi:hypothetical protein
MNTDKNIDGPGMNPEIVNKVKAELAELDREMVEVDGNMLKASQCYHFDLQPMHILFNTNCPDKVKSKVQAILSRYFPANENSPLK